MTKTRFIILLLLTTVLSFILAGLINYLLEDQGDWSISIIGIVFFSCFSILMFFLGNLAMKSENKYKYIQLVMGNMMLKMFATFVVVAVYYQSSEPTGKFFILPFLSIYLVYTVFETYFMIKQGKTKKRI